MMLNEPDIQPVDLHKIKIPTLVLAGEKDLIKKKVTKRLQKILSMPLWLLFREKVMEVILNTVINYIRFCTLF